jgi:hypothetical protein
MFQAPLFDTVPLVEHLHADGTYSPMEIEPGPDDPAQHDPERAWAVGQIFACKRCAERVRVSFRQTEDRAEGA